jgi:hypothetical protein
MRTFVHVIYVMFGDNKGNKKGWNPSEGFSLIFSRIKKFYRTAIEFNMQLSDLVLQNTLCSIKIAMPYQPLSASDCLR